jgi:hypothetical protein
MLDTCLVVGLFAALSVSRAPVDANGRLEISREVKLLREYPGYTVVISAQNTL